uniref:2-aminoethanethiol dioxygenase n=1 Tax=Peronospora matthiolae TaxID=2874970 RepID=A0AAV1U4H1_9STRA
MSFLNAVWRLATGSDKDLAAGQKALVRIRQLLSEAMSLYEGAPHALTLEQIAPIRAICDELTAANFRLKAPAGELRRSRHVHYQHVYEDKTFSIGIFILPPGVRIPLHDHPGMSVISRVLYGSVHIQAYDLVKKGTESSDKKHVARLCVDKVATAPYTTELLPACGNLHELIGGDDVGCAVLDIITPPYGSSDGRDCTYFRVLDSIENAENTSEKLVVLESYEPLDFDVVPEAYRGPEL